MRPFVQLLGAPCVLTAGRAVNAVRGHKAWGLLAYLALHRGTVTRQRLAGLLFEDALDPLAALRWNLRELRRAARAGMRELVVRAHLLRASLGDTSSASAASVLALEIDNPMLATQAGRGRRLPSGTGAST